MSECKGQILTGVDFGAINLHVTLNNVCSQADQGSKSTYYSFVYKGSFQQI